MRVSEIFTVSPNGKPEVAPLPASGLCRKCKRPVKATPFGVGHAVTFARTCAVDWHRAVA
jgi:hypothetical protein